MIIFHGILIKVEQKSIILEEGGFKPRMSERKENKLSKRSQA